MQKALDACKPLTSFKHESGLLRDPGTRQRLLAPGHGNTTQWEILYLCPTLCQIPVLSNAQGLEGNYLPDALLLHINNFDLENSARTKGTAQIPANRW